MPLGNYGLTAARGTTDTGNAISSADALAALRIAVGINPNSDPDGAGPLSPLKLSPYQLIAADVNKDGKISSADALAILSRSYASLDRKEAAEQVRKVLALNYPDHPYLTDPKWPHAPSTLRKMVPFSGHH